MIALTAEFTTWPGKEASFREAVGRQAAASRESEPGCLRFDVAVDPEDERRVLLYEIYADDAALAAHRETAHYAAFRAAADPLCESRAVTIWRLVDATDG